MNLFKIFGTIAVNNTKANKAIDDTSQKASGLSSAFSNAGKKIVKASAVVGSAATAVGGFAVKAASEYESSFAKVSTLLTGSEKDISEYKKSLLDASTETGIAASEMSEAVYSAISASVAQDKAIDFAKTASKLAKGGFTDTATAVDVMTTAINAYGLSADDATAISDKLINTQNLGKTTVNELASSMGKIIPTANSYSVNLDTLCGAYAEMTKNGIATAESTTYLNGMLNELGASGTIASTVIKEKTGKSFKELMDSGSSLSDVLGILKEEADKSGKSMGDMFGSQEAGKAANVLANNAKDLDKCIKSMGESSGTTEKAAGKMSDTIKAKVNKMKVQVTNSMTQLGNKIIPIVYDIFGEIQKIMPAIEDALNDIGKRAIPIVKSAFSKLGGVISNTNKLFSSMTSFFAKHTGVAKTLAVVMGSVTSAILVHNSAIKVYNTLQAIKQMWDKLAIGTYIQLAQEEGIVATAQLFLNETMNANPVMLLVSGIGLLVGALATLALTTDSATESTSRKNEAHQKLASNLKEQKDTIDQLNEQSKTTVEASMSQMQHAQELANELDGLADSHGKVHNKDKERAEFILGQLNEALGTEYTMTGNQINQYDKLKSSIKQTIEQKKRELLLAAYEEEYKTAIKERTTAQKNLEKATANYAKTKDKVKAKEDDYNRIVKQQTKVIEENKGKTDSNSQLAVIRAEAKIKASYDAVKAAKKEDEQAGKNYKNAVSNLTKYESAIQRYEKASEQALKGHSKKAEKILSSSSKEYLKIGKNYTLGLKKGIEDKDATSKLYASVERVVNKAIDKAKKTADEHSPSRRTRIIGQFLSLGISEGIKDEESTVTKQIGNSMNKWIGTATGLAGSLNKEMSMPALSTNSSLMIEHKNSETDEVKKAVDDLKNSMYDIFVNALSDGVRFKVDDREVGRMVKKYAR